MNTILFLAGVMTLLGVGVLIGSGLHTRSIDLSLIHISEPTRPY